ncbi:MAG TPA: ATP-binding protein [Trebonia sp.]|nr:ATP-binding protein [Trebonia sp.]
MEWPLFAGLGPVGALPTAARLARTFVRTIIYDWGLSCMAEDCELVISELVANVVQAAASVDGRPGREEDERTPLLWVRLLSDGIRLRAEVWDNLPATAGFPRPRDPASSEESGRGLGIVRALSLDWGWDTDRMPGRPHARSAKRVWALLEKS